MNKNILIILIGILLLIGCSDKGTDDYVGTSTFPLTTDSRWVYERNYYENSISDSTLVNTESYSVIRHVIGPDTIIDGNQLIAVDDSVAWADSVYENSHVNRHLYCISENKLKEFGLLIFLPWSEDEAFYYNPARVLLNLPLMDRKAWTVYESNTANVYSTVVGIEYVDVGDLSIKCDVIRTRQINPNTGYQYYDSYWWYSNDGLIRNEFDYGLREINDEFGNVIDTVRATDVLELLSMEI